MPHFPGIGHFSKHPHSVDHSSQCSLGADYRHSDQHTAILRQIQHHLGIISPPKHPIPIPPEPSQAPPFVHQTMPPKKPTTGEVEATDPSSPHHPPATI